MKISVFSSPTYKVEDIRGQALTDNLIASESINSLRLFPDDEYFYSLDYIPELGIKAESALQKIKAGSEFQKAAIDRALNDAVWEPSLINQNLGFFDLEGIHEALNWDVPRQSGWRMHPHNEAYGFFQESGKAWQLRLDVPRIDKDGDPVKYDSPKGEKPQVLMMSVPVDIRRKMRDRFDVDVPLTGSFWHWFCTSKEARKLPLVITEGGWKCGAILSLGIPAISLYGCSAGFLKRESRYDKRILCEQLDSLVYKRTVHIAFDQDEKAKTRRKVNGAIRTLGDAIAPKSTVYIAEWEATPETKGADDFIKARGREAFIEVINSAVPFKAWSKAANKAYARQVLTEAAALDVDIVANSRWVSDCGFPFPKLGEMIVLDSSMFTGKTFGYMKPAIEDFRASYGNASADLIGHRNNLLRQSASPARLNLEHIADLEARAFTQSRISATARIAYCINSLSRRFDALIRKMQAGEKVLLIFDEVDAVITELLTSSTFSERRRMQTIAQLGTLLRMVGDGHGSIIAGEANVSRLVVDAVREWSRGKLKITVCRNEHKPDQWQVFDHSTGGAIKNKVHAIALAKRLLEEGKRVMFLSAGQESAEQVEAMLKGYGTVKRIDSKTSSDPEIRMLMTDIDRELKGQNLILLVATPTIESGVSIGEDHFDAVILYACNLEPRALHQMLGRVRKPVPRHIFVTEVAEGGKKVGLNPDAVLAKWEKSAGSAIAEFGFKDQAIQDIEIGKQYAAKYAARTEAGAMLLRDTLIGLLEKDGHEIISEPLDIEPEEEKAIKSQIRDVKEVLASQFVEMWKGLDDSAISPKQAREMLRQELPYIDTLTAQKALEREKFAELVDDAQWVRTYWAEGRKSKTKRRSINNAAIAANPEMAKDSDRETLHRQIEATGTVWTPTFASKEKFVEALSLIHFDTILSIPEGQHMHGEDFRVTFVFRQALKHAAIVSDALGLTITEKSSPMGFINDLLKKLGAEILTRQITIEVDESDEKEESDRINCTQKTSNRLLTGISRAENTESPNVKKRAGRPKKGVKTKRVRVFSVSYFPFRQEMIDAIAAFHEKRKEEAEDPVIGGEIPGQVITLGGERFKVLSATEKTLRLFPAEVENPGLDVAITLSREEIAAWELSAISDQEVA